MMKILSGCYDISKNKLNDNSKNISRYTNDDFEIMILGHVSTGAQVNCFEKIWQLYQEHSDGITGFISGLYIIVIYDIKKQQLSVYQDRYTSPVTLYYTFKDEIFYFSTSLKKLLYHSEIKRGMNEGVIEEFFVNGFIYGDQTLIENVYKIKAFHCLHVTKNGIEQVSVDYPLKEYSLQYAKDHFKEVLDHAIIKQIGTNETEANTTLSGGYDSSYIVNVLSGNTQLPINAFSIGGKFGKNELPIVKQNVKYFPRTTLYSALTDSNTLQNFPDIVWRLEGNVFEVGLFLQYELSKLVHNQRKDFLICGEGADQIMNLYYFNEERRQNRAENGTIQYYEFSEYPYIFASYLILKKNGILANSFDIETRYPYLDNEFAAICKALSEYNGKNKRFHKENCNNCLPKEIVQNISKVGGTTECHSLFNGKKEIQDFFYYVENSSFFKNHRKLIKKHSYNEKIKPGLYVRLKTSVRNIVYGIIKKEINRSGDYFNEEIKLREYLNYTYLILFEELFVSGKHDSEFNAKTIQYKLNIIN